MLKRKGFTVVELLIVIGVIAILATIGGIVWRNSLQNATNSDTKSEVIVLKEAIESYRNDHGEYPWPNPSDCVATSQTRTCSGDQLAPFLVPKYISELPKDFRGQHYAYIVAYTDSATTIPTRYAIQVPIHPEGNCKTGKDMVSTWFDSATDCDF